MSFESLPDSDRQNHFNLLRLIAAASVIVSHAYSLTLGGEAPDPLQKLVGVDLGMTAVFAFFAISGYFISLSFDRRRSNLAFVMARITRILPGLLVVSLIAAFVVGPLLTELPMGYYFAQGAVWLYPLRTVALYGPLVDPQLPGLFVHNPASHVNGSLWTLLFEVSCYCGLFLVGVLGFLRRDRFAWVLAAWLPVYLFVLYGADLPDLQFFAIFSVPFLVGMAIFQYRPFKALNGWVAALSLAVAAALGLSGHLVQELWSAAVGYTILCLGFGRAPALLAYNKAGDYSYGTYIYGFLIGQVIVSLLPGISAAALMALSLPAAILCGALSWHFVERPALNLRQIAFDRTRKAKSIEPARP